MSKRRVESSRIFKRQHSAYSHSLNHPLRATEKATHRKLVDPTLSTPRGDKYYNQYRPLCEVCLRDHGKVVGPRSRASDFKQRFFHVLCKTCDPQGGASFPNNLNLTSSNCLLFLHMRSNQKALQDQQRKHR